jgi:hypothetical protein
MCRFAYKAAVAGVVCLSHPLAAQRVSGYLREATTAAPVPGAVVSLLDSAGQSIVRTVSAVDGAYRLDGSGRATSIRVVRIGFRPATRAIDRGRDTVVDIQLTILPRLLDAVKVRAQERCLDDPDGPSALAVWEQARSALLAGVVASQVDPPKVRTVSYVRDLGASASKIDRQRVSDSIYVASRPLVSARTAAQFAAHGFRDLASRTNATYYAPDAEVLLDSTFLNGHCLSLRTADHDRPDQVGIAFAPVPGQDSVVDVSGVLWVTETNPALTTLEFRYTNLPAATMDAGAGGELTFTTMPNGVMMITRWNIHIPLFSPDLSLRPRVDKFRDVGGAIAEATWHDGTSWLGALPTVSGHVSIAGSGAPVADAMVRFRGTRMETTTDSAGAFTLPMTVSGPYTVEATDVLMEELGTPLTQSKDVELTRSSVDDLRLVLPSRAVSIASLCDKTRDRTATWANGSNLLIGTVRLADGTPAIDAFVRAEWSDSVYSGGQAIRLTGRSDSTGTFTICGAPAGLPMTLSAARDSLLSSDASVAIDSLQHIARVTLTLEPVSAVALPAWRRRVVSVVDDPSHQQIAGVEIDDATTDRVLGITRAQGSVSLVTLPPGRSLLRVRKLGYEQRIIVVNVEPADTAAVELTLRTATQLATVTVTASATSRLAAGSGFEDRAAIGIGRFLRSTDFERRPDQRLADALQRIGVKQADVGNGTILLGGHARPCPLTIYIDGILFYSADWRKLGIAPPDVRTMFGTDFAGAEYYASGAETPPEYGGTVGDCGVLVLWRKY